jgi:hypothetical protein
MYAHAFILYDRPKKKKEGHIATNSLTIDDLTLLVPTLHYKTRFINKKALTNEQQNPCPTDYTASNEAQLAVR